MTTFAMSHKDRAVAGYLYHAGQDTELLEDRTRAKSLCHDYNRMHPTRVDDRNAILTRLFGKLGRNFVVEPAFYCDYGYNIEAGDQFYANHNLVILDVAKVVIGDAVKIGPQCGIYTASHPLEPNLRRSGMEYALPISIGSNVWIGGGSIILPGVTIGDDSIIGAGSVVTKDIPGGVVALGNPCRIVRKIADYDRDKYLV